MFDYLQQFNSLPKNLRDQVSSPAAMAVINDLEKKYQVELAALVMKVMIKSVPVSGLASNFISEFGLSQEKAASLASELKDRLFFGVANYLGLVVAPRVEPTAPKIIVTPQINIVPQVNIAPAAPIVSKAVPSFSNEAASPLSKQVALVIKQSQLSLPDSTLQQRLQAIIITYLKGIRSRIDTRLTLKKEISAGGLQLSDEAIDRLFKNADRTPEPLDLPAKAAILNLPDEPLEKLLPAENKSIEDKSVENKPAVDKFRALYEAKNGVPKAVDRDVVYDLKESLAKGQVSIPPEFKSSPELNIPVTAPKEEAVKPLNPVIIKSSSVPTARITPPPPKVDLMDRFKQMFNQPKVGAAPIAIPTVAPLSASVPVTPSPVILNKPNLSVASRRSSNDNSFNTDAVRAASPLRPQVVDMKPLPKTMGPVEELRYLDLVNFRRLGASPAEATIKVLNKIKLLEHDGYDKLIAGVKAWRQSPVNRTYVAMGQEALKNNLTLREFADKMEQAGNDKYLLWEEIEAIVTMNNQLMF
jgi:hypothetical protein